MSKLPPLDCLRAVVMILDDAAGRVPAVLAEDLDSAAALVEEAMIGWEAMALAPEVRQP
jgi:hypothetical protein